MSSLRWKLVGLYALILSVVIAGFSVILTLRLRTEINAAATVELETRASALGALIEYDKGRWMLEPKPEVEAEYRGDRGLFFVIFNEHGDVVERSALAQSLGLEADWPTDSAERSLRGRHFRTSRRSLTKRDELEEDKVPPRTVTAAFQIVCGKDMAASDAIVASLVRQLSIIGPLLLLASLLGGFALAGRALRPIDRITRTASQIQATDLSGRVEVRGKDELARLGATLNQMFDRLQEAFDRQTRFTADASHELRTPLSVVAGNVELALKRPRSNEEYRDILGDIQEATERMQSIVEGLLTLARADAKQIPLKCERVSLTVIADEIVRLCHPIAERQGVSVRVESDGDVAVTGDRERLKELVSNLLTNAIRYNRVGGRVELRLKQGAGRAELAIDDTGIGIPAEDLPHVFDRFYRADKARTREGGGSGLGLSIAKWIVDMHRGRISVTSRPGEGTCFLVSLPT